MYSVDVSGVTATDATAGGSEGPLQAPSMPSTTTELNVATRRSERVRFNAMAPNIGAAPPRRYSSPASSASIRSATTRRVSSTSAGALALLARSSVPRQSSAPQAHGYRALAAGVCRSSNSIA